MPQDREYQALAARHRPPTPVVANALRAFGVGGAISAVGQLVLTFFAAHGFSEAKAAAPTAVVVVGLGALFTGLGWYDEVVKFAGMGGSLPISGFSNAMTAPAMEYRREGLVLGVGAKLFTVAGPVLAFGLAAAFVVGLVRLVVGA
jgi:stage V sporulation protein AC